MREIDVIQVATVLNILRVRYGVDTDPAFGPLMARDYRLIAEGIREDWTSYAIADRLAEIHGWTRDPASTL